MLVFFQSRKFWAAAALASIAIFSFAQEPARAPRLVAGPIIQDVRPDRATVTFAFEMPPRTDTAGAPMPREMDYHRIVLKGLKPGESQEFNLKKEGVDTVIRFRTPPKEPAPFFFIVYGDTRTRHDVHAKVVARVLEEKPFFVLHTGDLISDGSKPADWDKFFEICRDFLREVPFYPTIGNHERNNPVFSQYFAFPGENAQHYSFDWGDVHIAMLNNCDVGNSLETREAFQSDQAEWLRQDLSRTRKPLRFVGFHQPLFTVVTSRRAGAERLRKIYEPVLLEGGVTAVFNGHDHNYQHHVSSGLHHLVTGGGGAPLYDGTPIADITTSFVKADHYVRVKVEGTKAHFDAIDLEGKVLDSFDLEGKGSK